ncbi:MAG: hypothetical protein R2697_11035 [Ilumatobacteraceae bacterium]
MSPIPAQAASIGGRSFDALTATVTREPGDEGVLPPATENAGISIFVQDDRLVVDYNALDDHTIATSGIPVPTATRP